MKSETPVVLPIEALPGILHEIAQLSAHIVTHTPIWVWLIFAGMALWKWAERRAS